MSLNHDWTLFESQPEEGPDSATAMPDDAHRVHGSRTRQCQPYRVLVPKECSAPEAKPFFPAPQQLSAPPLQHSGQWNWRPSRRQLAASSAIPSHDPDREPQNLTVCCPSVSGPITERHRPKDGVFSNAPNCQRHEVRCCRAAPRLRPPPSTAPAIRGQVTVRIRRDTRKGQVV